MGLLSGLFMQKSSDAEQEHHISVPGIEIEFNHATRTAIMIDQTGTKDYGVVLELQNWLRKKGWFLHVVIVAPQQAPGIIPEGKPIGG